MKKPEGVVEFVVNSIYIKLDIEKNNIFIFSLINRDNELIEKPIKSLSKGNIKNEVKGIIRNYIKYAKGTSFPDIEIEKLLQDIKKKIKKYFVRINRYKVQKGLPKVRKGEIYYD